VRGRVVSIATAAAPHSLEVVQCSEWGVDVGGVWWL